MEWSYYDNTHNREKIMCIVNWRRLAAKNGGKGIRRQSQLVTSSRNLLDTPTTIRVTPKTSASVTCERLDLFPLSPRFIDAATTTIVDQDVPEPWTSWGNLGITPRLRLPNSGKTIQKPCFCQKPPWINFDYLETLYSNYKSEKPCPAKVWWHRPLSRCVTFWAVRVLLSAPVVHFFPPFVAATLHCSFPPFMAAIPDDDGAV